MNAGDDIMTGRADLHTHTIHSDGSYSTVDLLMRARRCGLNAISITDHDNVSAVSEAQMLGESIGIEVITGVELSTHIDGREIHLLGYFVDVENQDLLRYLESRRADRLKRAEHIVDKLRSIKIPLRFEKVLEKAGDGAVGRPHIASAMVDEGFADSFHTAFTRYIGFGKPAYVGVSTSSAKESIEVITAAGGLSFLAHPGNSFPESVLSRLIKSGLDGMEVVHPSHTPATIARYRGIVGEYCLLESGGSDFHGGERNDEDAFGRYTISVAAVEAMRRSLVPE